MSLLSKPVLYSATALSISELRDVDDNDYQLDDSQQTIYDEMQEWLAHEKIVAYTMDDHEYHFKFAQISSAPYVIYGI